MNITTRFGQIKLIAPNIAELIINQNIVVTLELMEEYDALMSRHFNESYGVLVNRLNNYSYTFEALLCIGSAKNLKAAAVINYGHANEEQIKGLAAVRQMDDLNIKEFSGLELGRDNAISWLEEQLNNVVSA